MVIMIKLFNISNSSNFLLHKIGEISTVYDHHEVYLEIPYNITNIYEELNVTSKHLSDGDMTPFYPAQHGRYLSYGIHFFSLDI